MRPSYTNPLRKWTTKLRLWQALVFSIFAIPLVVQTCRKDLTQGFNVFHKLGPTQVLKWLA